MSLGLYWDNIAKKSPLIHHITNYVTVNDVANITLACGASPIMADCQEEVTDITALTQGLCLNIGTLNQRHLDSMLLAASRAAQLQHPTVLDPVGAGASPLRTNAALSLLHDGQITVIRGNISEVKTLLGDAAHTQGVDAAAVDSITPDNLPAGAALAKKAAAKLKVIVAITGAIDLVADQEQCYVIRNGRPEMRRITGTGCQCSALTAAAITANPDEPLPAAAAAICAMGLAGEIAYQHLAPHEGNATYRNRIIDAIYNLTGAALDKGANYEIL